MTSPIRAAHGWAIMWLDVYQTPAVVAKSWTEEIGGFFGELKRKATGGTDVAAISVANENVNKLGRKRLYGADESWRFGTPY